MELSELDEWADDFEAFHSQFSSLFGRREVQEQAVKYLQGLVSPVERKNGGQLAEAVGDKRPDATQRLLYKTKWDAEAVRDAFAAICDRQVRRWGRHRCGRRDGISQEGGKIGGRTASV